MQVARALRERSECGCVQCQFFVVRKRDRPVTPVPTNWSARPETPERYRSQQHLRVGRNRVVILAKCRFYAALHPSGVAIGHRASAVVG